MRWQTFHARIQEGISSDGLREIEKSFLVMDVTHDDSELRDNDRPYRSHPEESTIRAYKMGERDPAVLCAILTHDVLESAAKLGKPITSATLARDTSPENSQRVQWMTKKGHREKYRAASWKIFHNCNDAVTYKAKCYERLDNVLSFKDMKAKPEANPPESRRARIKRKVNETVVEFSPIISWLEHDVEIRSFKSEAARNDERMLIQRIRQAFDDALRKYGAKLK